MMAIFVSCEWRNYKTSTSARTVNELLTIRLNKIKELQGNEHGQYTEIKDEKAVLDLTTWET